MGESKFLLLLRMHLIQFRQIRRVNAMDQNYHIHNRGHLDCCGNRLCRYPLLYEKEGELFHEELLDPRLIAEKRKEK